MEKAASRQQNKTKPRQYGLSYRGLGKCGRVVIIFVGKHTQYIHGSRGRWPHTFRKQAQYRHVEDGCGGVTGRGIHLSWEIFDALSSYFEQNRHKIHTEQDGCGKYLNQNRHGTVSTYTTGMEAYLDYVHLPRGYRHYFMSQTPR